MKINQLRFSLGNALLAGTLLFASCSDDDSAPVAPEVSTGVYVLNEGLFNGNNSSLTFYDFESETPFTDFFAEKNDRGLGDTGNDIKRYGSKIYIVVNGSSQLEVIDLKTGESIEQIPMFDDETPRQPRNIAFHKQYAYVCSFDGTVGRLDTATLVFDKFITVGQQPDGICVANDKLYVSNSGGLNYPVYDNTISVINTTTFEEIKKITVVVNPGTLKADSDGDVYVVSRGNYDDIAPAFQRINASNDQVTTIEGVQTDNFAILGDVAYLYSYSYATEETCIKVFNAKTETVTDETFIADDTEVTIPYGIDVDPTNGDVYVTDAIDFTVAGDVHCFDKNGTFKFKFEAGLNPNHVVFVTE